MQVGPGFGFVTRYMLERSLQELGLAALLTGHSFLEYFCGIYAVYSHPILLSL